MRNDCLFCGITDGEIPSYKIYEDASFIVIFDRFPKCLGHVLILPKAHAETLFDLPAKTAAKVLPLAKKVAVKLRSELDFTGLNLLQNNGADAQQSVRHFHLHLIPRYGSDAMVAQWKTLNPSPEEFEDMLKKLKM
jgi:histidine triad (HIT) family protein